MLIRASRPVLILTLAMLFLQTAAATPGGRDKGTGEKEPRKPKIKLRVDPSYGFTPVTAVLTGELRGVDPADPNFCHAAITWIRIDPGRSAETGSTLRQNPVCRHAEEETRVKTFFTKTFTLARPGYYLFRLRIEGKNGKRIESGYARVRVLRVQ